MGAYERALALLEKKIEQGDVVVKNEDVVSSPAATPSPPRTEEATTATTQEAAKSSESAPPTPQPPSSPWPAVVLEGHDGGVGCLAALEGGRLASGSWVLQLGAIRIWSSPGADAAQAPPLVLEGHDKAVTSLAALEGGRLASGSRDGTIRIWTVAGADAAQASPFVLKERGLDPLCLAALDGGHLVSASKCPPCAIRVRNASAILRITACTSPFDFEEAARKYDSGQLFDAAIGAVVSAVTPFKYDEEAHAGTEAWDASAAVVVQAHVFDAIATVVGEDEDSSCSTCASKRIDDLAPRVLDLVKNDKFLTEWRDLGVTNDALETLAPSPLFRVVLDVKYASGAIFTLYFEILLFVVLVFCFARVASLDVLGFSKWFAAEKVVEVVVAFLVIAYFSVREVLQMAAARRLEMAAPNIYSYRSHKDNTIFSLLDGRRIRGFEPNKLYVVDYDLEGLAFYTHCIPRCFVLFAVGLVLSPVLLVISALSCAGFQLNVPSWCGITSDDFENGPESRPAGLATAPVEPDWPYTLEDLAEDWVICPILHDPFTFLGLARSWRRDYWNWFDVAFLASAWAAFAIASGSQLSEDLAVVTTILLGVKLCSLVRYTNESFARFILMIEKIVYDLRVFVIFFFIILLVFAFSFCPRCK